MMTDDLRIGYKYRIINTVFSKNLLYKPDLPSNSIVELKIIQPTLAYVSWDRYTYWTLRNNLENV
jgi:hypothetical protein